MTRAKQSESRLNFTWSKEGPGITEIIIPTTKSSTKEYSFLLCSDRHWDNPHSDREMMVSHLNEAAERGAGVIENGDLFCAMQGKYDKRADKSSVRKEHQFGDYLDRLVETCNDWWSPWRDLLILCGEGNHEESIKNRHETDLTQRFCALMNASGGKVINGGYGGFIKFSFKQKLATGKPGFCQSVVMHYSHGFGGGGKVTADMVQSYHQQVYLPDADIIWTAHTHDDWVRWIARKRLSQQNVIYQDLVAHVKTSTYKDDYGAGEGGWHVRTGKPPKPLGAYWLNFKWSNRHGKILFDFQRAT